MKFHLNGKIVSILPVFISVNIAAILIWKLNIASIAMPMILGIIAAGLVDSDNSLTGRLTHIFITLITFSLSAISAQWALNDPIWYAILMTVFTFVLTMLGAIGQRYRAVAFGTLIIALYMSLIPSDAGANILNPALIVSGALLYNACSLLVYFFFSRQPLIDHLANSYLNLADYLESKARLFDPDEVNKIDLALEKLPVTAAVFNKGFNECRQALSLRLSRHRNQSKNASLICYYNTAQEIYERASASHVNYRDLANSLTYSDLIFRIQRLLDLIATECRTVSTSIRQQKDYQPNERLKRALEGIIQSYQYWKNHPDLYDMHELKETHFTTMINNLQNMTWSFLALSDKERSPVIAMKSEKREPYSPRKPLKEIYQQYFNLDSVLFRHATRLSLVVFVCCLIAYFSHLERGYWILLTALFVCQPNYSATKSRLIQRVVGTILGVIIGSLLPFFMVTLEAKFFVLVLSSTLFFFFVANDYRYSIVFITIQMLTSFDISGFDLYSVMQPRLIDTVIGTAISWLAVFYLWPDWHYMKLTRVIKTSLQSSAKYMLYAIAKLQFGEANKESFKRVQICSDEASIQLDNAVRDMNSEPKKYQNYLSNSVELLRLIYILNGYISALVTYSQYMDKAMSLKISRLNFYPFTRELVKLVENLDQYDIQQLQQRLRSITEVIVELENESQLGEQDNQQMLVVYQQLSLITRLLPKLHTVIERQLHLEVS